MIRFGFITFLSCFSREVVVGGVYSFFLQRAVSPCFGGMLFDYGVNVHIRACSVLILVLMECSLTSYKIIETQNTECLNPCSNGILSDFIMLKGFMLKEIVLILVLMECSLTLMNILR